MQNINEDDFGSATDLTELDKLKIRKMYNCLPQTRPESNTTFTTYHGQFSESFLRISACGKSIVPQTFNAQVATQIQEPDIKTVSYRVSNHRPGKSKG